MQIRENRGTMIQFLLHDPALLLAKNAVGQRRERGCDLAVEVRKPALSQEAYSQDVEAGCMTRTYFL